MDISLTNVAVVPVVLALTEVAKMVGVPSKWTPVISIVLGVSMVWLSTQSFDLLGGILVGLSASGLWSGTKSILK